MLWADLAKLARKQNVWDVALAAAKFCLLYDDGRWTIGVLERILSRWIFFGSGIFL